MSGEGGTGTGAGGSGWNPGPIGEGWTAGAVAPNVAVEVGAEPAPLTVELEAAVTAIWERACAERPALFNGRVFSIDRIEPDRLVGHWTEYRRVLAQLRRPALFERLRLRPLAVNALVECDDAVLLGRRQDDAVYLPGRWQAAPSGNVEDRGDGGDPLDLPAQVLAELDEELGVVPADVAGLRPVLAIEHARSHVVDVGFLLRVALPFEAVRAAHRARGNREYAALRAVGRAEAAGAGPAGNDALLPSARALLRSWAEAEGRGSG